MSKEFNKQVRRVVSNLVKANTAMSGLTGHFGGQVEYTKDKLIKVREKLIEKANKIKQNVDLFLAGIDELTGHVTLDANTESTKEESETETSNDGKIASSKKPKGGRKQK